MLKNKPNKKAIGIMGGTFDPIHFGHLRAAQEIYERLSLDEIRLFPCKEPPHRTTPVVSPEDRLAMIKLAIQDSNLWVDDRELHRLGPSYTVDTLRSLRKEFPNASLALIIGVDAFLGLPTWHEWDKILELTNIVVIHRSGWTMPTAGTMAELLLKHHLNTHEKISDFEAGKITQQAITSIEISASTIRSLIQAGHSAHFLLPSNVLDYIETHHLYGFRRKDFSETLTEVAHI